MNETQTNDFLEKESLGKLMQRYAIPCIISLLVGALYNIVDQIFIANADYLGSYGNAANTVVFPLTVVALAVATMIGDGCCAFVSISLGAKEKDNAHRSIGSSIIAVIISSIVIAAIYLIFQNQILTAFGATVNAETFALSKEYFTYISIGIPFYMFGQALNPIIRSDGSPRFAMISLLAGSILNVILDPIFIFIFHWGMMGAAVATVAGQIVGAAFAVIYLFRMKTVKLDRDSFKFRTSLMKKVLPLGATSFLSQISMVLSMAAVLNMLSKYGAVDDIFGQPEYAQIPTAVVGIVMKFFQIVISISIGLAAGCIPVVGYNIGAGRTDRAKGLFTRLLAAEAVIGAVAFFIFELFPKQLIGIFGAGNESVYYTEFAIRCIRIFLCMIILSCLNKGTTIFLQSLGKARESTALSTLREIVCGVGLPLLLPVFLGLDGILYFMALADIITFIISAFVIAATYKALSPQDKASIPETQAVPETVLPAPDYIAPLHTVITIGRSYGAGGRTVGKQLARQLHIPYYDTELLAAAAKESGLSEKFMESMDEKTARPSMLYGYTGNAAAGEYVSMESVAYKAQAEIIEQVAAKGSCVIVGRRADQILKEHQNVFSIFISAPFAQRTKRVMERDHLSKQDSEKKIRKADKGRAAYYNQLSNGTWGAADSYDLCIKTGKFTIDETANAIIECVKKIEKN